MHEFDLDRAILNSTVQFQPFHVHETVPLRKAIAGGRVNLSRTTLLVRPHVERPLAFEVTQMAYHRVAYGQIEGEPWMISF